MLEPGKNWPGSPIRIEVSFTDANGDAVDPDTALIKIRSPLGQTSTYTYGSDSEIGKSSTGNYYADITPDRGGRWFYRWETTGTGSTIKTEGNFTVQYSSFVDEQEIGYQLP